MYNWTTDDELDYLRRIGCFTAAGEERTTQRKIDMLRNYILAARMRSHWGEVDGQMVLRAARTQLHALEMRVG